MRNNIPGKFNTGKLNIGKTLFALAMIVTVTNTFATTARADEWRDHERDAREWHHHMHRHDRPVIVREPNVVYAPPVVVQSPSAVIDASSPGLNITVPINFR